MTTVPKLTAAYEALDKLMTLASAEYTGDRRIAFEIDTIALYLGSQLVTLKPSEREAWITELRQSIATVIETKRTGP